LSRNLKLEQEKFKLIYFNEAYLMLKLDLIKLYTVKVFWSNFWISRVYSL